MINNLQVLRSIGAIMIFIHHFGFNEPISRSIGDFAVAIFMMLSGFVLCAAHQEKYVKTKSHPTIKYFICTRILKIYPLYFVSLLVMLYLYRFEGNPVAIILDLLLLQSWIPNSEYYFSGNAPAWFLSSIFFSYLIFFPFIKLITGKSRIIKYVVIGSIYTVYLLLVLTIPSQWVTAIIYINPVMQSACFILGIILWQLYNKVKSYNVNYISVLVAVLVCVIFDIIAIKYNIPERFTLAIWWWFPASTLILSLSMTDRLNNIISKILKNKHILAFGNASFSFYLIHVPWLVTTRIIMHKLNINIPLGLEFALSLTLLIPISILINKYFDKPSYTLLNKALNKSLIKLQRSSTQ